MSNVSVIAAVEALERADLAAADTAVCADLLRHVRRTRGWLDAVEARISSRARDLASVTPEASGPADTAVGDMHGAIGGTTAAEGRRRERRSKALDDAPSFADALENGKVSSDHVDALANATAGLDDAIKSELLADEESLLAAATSRTPEEFARVCRDRIRRLERDHGISRNRQQRHRHLPATEGEPGDRDDRGLDAAASRARQPDLRCGRPRGRRDDRRR